MAGMPEKPKRKSRSGPSGPSGDTVPLAVRHDRGYRRVLLSLTPADAKDIEPEAKRRRMTLQQFFMNSARFVISAKKLL